MKTIANRQATREEINLSKKMTTVDEARQRVINAGGFPIFQKIIDDPTFLQDLLAFYQNYTPTILGYQALLQWFQENDLEKFLREGSLEKEIKKQEIFYQNFYGKDFQIDRKKIFVDSKRLPAIKAGLKEGVVNKALIKAIPDTLFKKEELWTESQFFAYRILKKIGMQIWAKTGTARWTDKTFDECLAGFVNVLPEDFSADALRKNWEAECLRVVNKKGAMPKVVPGSIEISFVDGRQDVSTGQKYVNQVGEMINVDDYSFITAVEKNIKLVTPAEEVIIACQFFDETGEYSALNTWEFNSALLGHDEVNPVVSVVDTSSCGNEFRLGSCGVGRFGSGGRFRLSL